MAGCGLRIGGALAAIAVLAAPACHQTESIIVAAVSAEPDVPAITQLRVTLSNAGTSDLRVFPQVAGGGPISFPATLAIVIGASRSGTLDLAMDGLDARGNLVANAAGSTMIALRGRTELQIRLRAGASSCGNSRPDPGEECDDGNRVSGDGCDALCRKEIPDAGALAQGGQGGGDGAGGRGGMSGTGASSGGSGGSRVDAAVDIAPDTAPTGAPERSPIDMAPGAVLDAAPQTRPDVGPPPGWLGPATPILVVVGNGGRRMFSTEIKLVDMAGVQGPQVTFNDTRDEAVNTGLSPKDLKRVLYADHQVIAVGGHEFGVDSSSRIMTFDGKDWKDVPGVPTGQGRLEAVAFGNGIWVAGGKRGPMLRSLDHGKTWEATGLSGKPCCIRDVAFGRMAGKDVFVAVADGYAIVKSEDGLVWDMVNSSNGDFSNGFKSVAFGGDAAVTVGGPDATGRKYRFDGKVAANDMIAGPGLHTVLFVDNKFSAYGNMNTMFTSGDGVNWTMQTIVNSGSSGMLQANLTIKNLMNMDVMQKLFITRSSSTVKTSPDGLTFTNAYSNPAGENSLISLTLATGM